MAERSPLPEAVARPERGRVLALAPHPDDEVIGCGGTLVLHALQGDAVSVLVVFDGRAGLSPGEPAERRRREARAGGRELGVDDYAFWDLPEGHPPGGGEWRAAVHRLSGFVERLAPDAVYAPWIGEHHLDHHSVACAARLALEEIDFRGAAWGYEVWTPLVPERVVDVGASVECKRAALLRHASQGGSEMARRALGMCAHRSLYLPGGRWGEAFAPLGRPDAAERALLAEATGRVA